jgi:nucleoside diphosphate kinase
MKTLVLAAVAVLTLATKCTLQDQAFMFIKPHAMRSEVRELVLKKLREKGLIMTGEGHRSAEGISHNSHIDTHYGVIASRAMRLHPSKLKVRAAAAARFEQVMGVAWTDAVERGNVYNAKNAMAKLEVDSKTLDSRWNALKKGVNIVKLGSGFYVGRFEHDVFVVNGFFLSMREEYTSGPGVHYLQVSWPRNANISWSSFRNDLLGATDPTTAHEGSIRRALHDNYVALGLSDRPHTGTNGVHASASALEAMVERMNWLGTAIGEDPMGRALLEAGISAGSIRYWSKDPVVEFEGVRQSVFDLVQDMGAAECLTVLTKLGGRDCPGSKPGSKDLVPCGYFAWRSISDHSIAGRKNQCESRALVCAGHFAFKSVSDHTLAARRKDCNETSLVPCGYKFDSAQAERLAQCNETALVPCGHFEQS